MATAAAEPARTLPPRGTAVLAFGLMVAFMTVQGSLENAFAPLQSEMAAELRLTDAQSSMVSASYLVAFAAFQLPAGMLVDRLGVARLLPWVVLATGVSALLMAQGSGMANQMAARALLGLTGACIFPAAAAMARASAPMAAFAFLMGMADFSLGAGGMFGVLAGNAAENAFGWRNALLLGAALALPFAVLLRVTVHARWFGPTGGAADPRESPFAGIADVMRRRDTWLAMLVMCGGMGTFCGFGGMWNLKLAESWAWREPEATIISSCFYAGMAIGAPVTGWLGGRFGPRRVLLAGMAAALPLFLFWLLVPVAWPLWFDACNVGVIGFALSTVVLAYEVATCGLPARRVASAIAVLNLAGVLAGAVLELIPGIVASIVHASPLRTTQAANAVFALSLAGTLAAAWWLPRGVHHHSGPPE
jgi:MFS family permease